MKTADQIEREIHTKFAEQVYVGMSTTDYHSALAHVVVRYVAEQLASPCVFEARTDNGMIHGSARAWCQTHGFACPTLANASGQERIEK